jgi:hypothetical protein
VAKKRYKPKLSAEISYFLFEDISMLTKECESFSFGYNNRVFSKLVSEITFCRIGLAFRKYVPDSGQEHTA